MDNEQENDNFNGGLPVVSINDTRGKVVHTENARGNSYGAKHMGTIQGAILNQHFNIKKHYCMIMAMTLPAC